VVLACRVSPKQKAEIVMMMRERNPDKTTLAIGDGANDVNMITAAHIGVGISGLEGQQAARASDYSIGQFRFVKNMLFHHGRENYRRNTYAIAYMFYKNVLLVMPIWFYGVLSRFSGTQIYNLQLYSAYNVIFTAVPVIWFTTWDKEYTREVLLKRPRLYRIGLENVYFNNSVFWRWFFYATWQGILMVMVIFETMTENSPNIDGMYSDLFAAGSYVFSCIVIVVNMKILISSFEVTLILLLLVIASIAIYFVAFWFITYYNPAADDFDVFYELMTFSQSYMTIIFFTFSYVLIDAGMRYASLEINAIFIRRKEL